MTKNGYSPELSIDTILISSHRSCLITPQKPIFAKNSSIFKSQCYDLSGAYAADRLLITGRLRCD
jgi:hypothetical protein